MIQEQTLKWEKKKLGEIVSFKTGKLNSNASKPNGAFPFFTCSQETFRTDTYSFDTECVLLGGNNANGVYPIKYFSGKFDAYQRTYIIRALDNKILSNSYLFFALKLKLELLKNISTGVATKFLTLTILNDIEIDLPPLPTQRKISSILSAYDDLIENNTRRIKILEEMAQALYREWFVKFRFPGHEKVGMVESELGMVPEGWEVDSLSDHITLDKGISYKGEFLTDDGLPMVNLKCILPNGGFRRDGTKPYSGDYKPKHTVKPGDLVIANTDLTQAGNVIGSPAIVPNIKTSSDILISHHLYAIRFKNQNQIIRYFLYNLMQIYEFKSFAKGRANGTTVLGLPQDGVLDFSFAKPPTELLNQFEMLITPMYEKIEIHERKNDALRRTRDLLLPKLISGEVDVEKIDVRMTINGGG